MHTRTVIDGLVVLDEFESIYDLLAHIEGTKNKEGKYIKYRGTPGSALSIRTEEWCDYRTMNDYVQEITEQRGSTYDATLNEITGLCADLTTDVTWQTTNYKRQKRYSNTGTAFHSARVWRGYGHKAFSSRKRETRLDSGGVVTLIIPVTTQATTSAERITRAYLASHALAIALEQCGKQTEIWLYSYIQGAFLPAPYKGKPCDHMLLQCAKTPRERHQINQLAASFFPDYLRRFVFRLEESASVEYAVPLNKKYGVDGANSNVGINHLTSWVKARGIDTDSMLITLAPSNDATENEQDVKKWITETLNAINN